MSAINYAIREVGHRIPSKILSMLFSRPGGYSCDFSPTTLETQIRQRIIYDRVLTDLDIMAGLERFLPIGNGEIQHQDSLGTSYFYSHKMLHNLDIVSVHYFTTNRPPMTSIMGGAARRGTDRTTKSTSEEKCMYNDMYENFQKEITKQDPGSTLTGLNVDVTATLIAKNTVFASNNRLTIGWFKVVLSNDPELTRLPNRVWRKFAKLVELATKAYIYKESVITIELATVTNGMPLAGVNSLIETYAEAEEQYQEQLDLWSSIGLMLDKPAYARYIRSQIGKIF